MVATSVPSDLSTQHPPCPYCGERQSYDEAIPGKPRVGKHPGAWVRGKWRDDVKPTDYDTHCRACRERIVWGFTYTVQRLEPAASWSKP